MIKPIDEYDGYFISDDGKVFCNLGKGNRDPQKTQCLYEVKGRPTKHGYLRVYARNRKNHRRSDLYIHRLVGQYFLPRPETATYINHKNCIRSDNRAENLEWCTAKHNTDQTMTIRHLLRDASGRYVSNFKYNGGTHELL